MAFCDDYNTVTRLFELRERLDTTAGKKTVYFKNGKGCLHVFRNCHHIGPYVPRSVDFFNEMEFGLDRKKICKSCLKNVDQEIKALCALEKMQKQKQQEHLLSASTSSSKSIPLSHSPFPWDDDDDDEVINEGRIKNRVGSNEPTYFDDFFSAVVVGLHANGISCASCSKGCVTGHCPCSKNGQRCGSACGCKSCKNHKNEYFDIKN